MIPQITSVASVYRLTRTGDKEAYGVSPIYTGLDCAIYPASTDIAAVYPGEPSFSLYEIFFSESVTIRNGDKFVTSGQEYIVQGVPQVFDNHLAFYQRVLANKVI